MGLESDYVEEITATPLLAVDNLSVVFNFDTSTLTDDVNYIVEIRALNGAVLSKFHSVVMGQKSLTVEA